MIDEPIERDDYVVMRKDALRQIVRVDRIRDGRLRGTYVLPDGQIEIFDDAPVELYRRASAEEVRAAGEGCQLPP